MVYNKSIKEIFMKNHYVGDINDYRKYYLLENIKNILKKEILIVWMLTSGDGEKTDYLKKENIYYNQNKDLFNDLKKIIDNDKRNIETVQKTKALNGCKFHSIKLNKKNRANYFKTVFEKAEEVDLVFFDPDKGICPNKKPNKSTEYLYWDEIHEIWKMKKDILVYQQFRRIKNFSQIIKKECEKELKNSFVTTFETKNLLFIYITHEQNENIEKIKEKWNKINETR
jgi:hypothetical protein